MFKKTPNQKPTYNKMKNYFSQYIFINIDKQKKNNNMYKMYKMY